jgi:hypothetical protein
MLRGRVVDLDLRLTQFPDGRYTMSHTPNRPMTRITSRTSCTTGDDRASLHVRVRKAPGAAIRLTTAVGIAIVSARIPT